MTEFVGHLSLVDSAVGDEAALSEAYARFAPVAYGLAFGIVRDVAAAEEIVCAAFVETLAGRPESRDVRIQLLAAVHRRAAAFVRASYPRPAQRLPEPGVLPNWLTLQRETAWGLLSRLSVVEREVIELAYFGCYTLSEIATRLGLSAETVSGHLSRGLGRLAGQLGVDGAGSPGLENAQPGNLVSYERGRARP